MILALLIGIAIMLAIIIMILADIHDAVMYMRDMTSINYRNRNTP